jgi:hypothetical protein
MGVVCGMKMIKGEKARVDKRKRNLWEIMKI